MAQGRAFSKHVKRPGSVPAEQKEKGKEEGGETGKKARVTYNGDSVDQCHSVTSYLTSVTQEPQVKNRECQNGSK